MLDTSCNAVCNVWTRISKNKMATTISKLGLPVLALKRPQHEVEMFNFALSNDCTLVMSNQTSKSFICYEIVNEFYQNESKNWAVVMVDDSSGEQDFFNTLL